VAVVGSRTPTVVVPLLRYQVPVLGSTTPTIEGTVARAEYDLEAVKPTATRTVGVTV
jgi:hypothetical protein